MQQGLTFPIEAGSQQTGLQFMASPGMQSRTKYGDNLLRADLYLCGSSLGRVAQQ